MAEKKQLDLEELEKANGGHTDNDNIIYCVHCCKEFNSSHSESRETGSGCSATKEYKCPTCDNWYQR